MKCGILGLPNVGKSTIFNCLSNAKAQAINFPFSTIEPNIGYVSVPDIRLIKLQEIIQPKRIIPAKVEIIDIAGLVKGAHKGEGLGNKFLSKIREVHAIIHVLRCFYDPNIMHVEGNINPIRDKEIIDTELKLKDLDIIKNHLEKIKLISKSRKQEQSKYLKFLERLFESINNLDNISTDSFSIQEQEKLKSLQLLTVKPRLYLCNIDISNLKKKNRYIEIIQSIADVEKSEVVILNAKIEAEIAELTNYEDKLFFLQDLGIQESGISTLIRKIYNLLHLQTYFTVGPQEVRAWTIKKGCTASQAACIIHSDFSKGFIRAEVIHYQDFIFFGSKKKARESGYMFLEGKDYLVQDGDIIHFRVNI